MNTPQSVMTLLKYGVEKLKLKHIADGTLLLGKFNEKRLKPFNTLHVYMVNVGLQNLCYYIVKKISTY